MKTKRKFLSRYTNGKLHLILMFVNLCKKLFILVSKAISNHAGVFFNNVPIKREPFQKHFGLFLDKKLKFLEHINKKVKKVTKKMILLCNLNFILRISSPVIIYKSFVKHHQDYGDTAYAQPNNK